MSYHIRRKLRYRRSSHEEIWTLSDVCKLVLMLKPHPLLWDPRDIDYDDQEARAEVLSELARDLPETGASSHTLLNKVNKVLEEYKSRLYMLLVNPCCSSQLPWFSYADIYMRGPVLDRAEDLPHQLSFYMHKEVTSHNGSYRLMNERNFFALNWNVIDCMPRNLKRLKRLAAFLTLNEYLDDEEDRDWRAIRSLYSKRSRVTPYPYEISNPLRLNAVSNINMPTTSEGGRDEATVYPNILNLSARGVNDSDTDEVDNITNSNTTMNTDSVTSQDTSSNAVTGDGGVNTNVIYHICTT